MALKKKITKVEFEALPEFLKKEYKGEGDDFTLDLEGEEDTGALKRAKEHEVLARKTAEKQLKEAQDAMAALNDEKSRASGDVKALEESWSAKLEAQALEAKTKTDRLTNSLSKTYVGDAATKLAHELSEIAPKALLPHIERRLSMEFDGDTPKTRILDAAGNVSALTLEDLKNEFIANEDFSGIIIGSKGGGSAPPKDKDIQNPAAGGAKEQDLSSFSPAQMVEYLDNL